MTKRLALAAAMIAMALAACAAERATSSSPATAPPADQAPKGAATESTAQPVEPPAVTRERAKSEIKQAEIELGQAGSDCTRACKALASMERATAHLCSVVSTPDDQHQCDDARQKLQSSRDRVRGACGECQR